MRPGSALVLVLTLCTVVPLVAGRQLSPLLGGAIVAAASLMLFARIDRRTLVPDWVLVIAAHLRRRRRPIGRLPAAADVTVLAGKAGIRWQGETLVAAVEVAPALALTREGDDEPTTSNVLPLDMVVGFTQQYGLDLNIDVVSAGEHVPVGSAYRTVYSQFVGSRPFVAQRRTWLVLRLNAVDNLDGIAARGPSRRSAPRALATAAYRVVQRLGEQRIRAHALSGAELDNLSDVLLNGVAMDGCDERWSTIRTDATYVTTYVADPTEISTIQLHRWWAWRTEHTTVTIRITSGPRIGALVRYATLGNVQRPPTGVLTAPAGVQGPLLQAALPGGDVSLAADIPSATYGEALRDIQVPIGPAGQILGHDDGAMVAVSLCDHSGRPERLRVDAGVDLLFAHQLVLRAVVTGSVVGLHAADRTRWDTLVASVNDPRRLFFATAGARDCDIAVFDATPVTTVPARTVLTLSDGQLSPNTVADLVLTQRDRSKVTVAVRHRPPVEVTVVRTREEDRYLGIDDRTAQPRRVVRTDPVLTRSPRRREAEDVPRKAASVGVAHSNSEPRYPAAGRSFRFAEPRRTVRGQPAQPAASAPRRRPKLPPTPPSSLG
ncbi:type VII secretion protein EccE [Mycobacterium sp. LTG2003]